MSIFLILSFFFTGNVDDLHHSSVLALFFMTLLINDAGNKDIFVIIITYCRTEACDWGIVSPVHGCNILTYLCMYARGFIVSFSWVLKR